MNIFVLDEDIALCAQYHMDKHIVKMPLETAQMLSTAVKYYDPEVEGIYKPTHLSHPCSVWARTTRSNFLWLCELGLQLCTEFDYRYHKTHACEQIIEICRAYDDLIPEGPITPFAQAMPNRYKNENAVTAYRNYYIHEKAHIASWRNGNVPYWWVPK